MNRASGASKSGYDVLRALSDVQSVEVISNRNLSFKKLTKLSMPAQWSFIQYPVVKGYGLKSIYRKVMNILSQKIYNLNGCEKDLLIVNSFCLQLLNNVDLCGFKGKKICVVRGSVSSFESIDSTITVKESIEYLSQFDSLIYVSAKTQEEWQKFDGITNQPSYYIPNCCDEEAIQSLSSKSKLIVKYSGGVNLNDKYIVSCIGSVQHRKGQDLLIDSILKIRQVEPEITSRLHVFIVGGDVGGFSSSLLQKIEANNLSDIFTFTGYTTKALEYLKISNLMVLPSRGEAMPRSVLEAMLMNVPVISTDLDGMPELIHNSVGGILTKPNSVDEISEAIMYAINNESKMNAMATYSHDKYWKSFSRCAQFERYKNLLRTNFV
jgi:glycosyltransferase involved in cell wall biosynthesis